MLKYDINAFVIAEDVLGQSVTQIAASLAVSPKLSTIRGLYWAGNLHKNSKMKLSEAGEEMQKRLEGGEQLGDIVNEICKAIESSGIFPKQEDAEAADPQTSPANS
ncbi:MAG TPA: hypothetical protein PLR50_00865 [Candidatus Rifleibacterium sp.]|nr:hypothetical protein [Candidatus Rifleibacterium sp.]